MNWKKLSPWNWFKKENQQVERRGAHLPADRDQIDHPVVRMHRELDRMFENMFGAFGSSGITARNLLFGSDGAMASILRPQLDIAENDKDYTITVEVPGVERDDIDISVDDGALLIRGEKRQSSEDKSGDYHAVERSYGRFQRILDLPDDADEDNISAKFKNGVLTVTVPRAESARRGRRIEVES